MIRVGGKASIGIGGAGGGEQWRAVAIDEIGGCTGGDGPTQVDLVGLHGRGGEILGRGIGGDREMPIGAVIVVPVAPPLLKAQSSWVAVPEMVAVYSQRLEATL